MALVSELIVLKGDSVRNLRLFLLALQFALILIGCAPSLKYIKDYNVPLEKESYSILPPKGENWVYDDNSQSIIFGKQGNTKSHTYVAEVVANYSYDNLNFKSPEDYLEFMKNTAKIGTDPRRFEIQEEEMVLDNKFGPYCVRYYVKAEDRYAAERNKTMFMIMELYQYHFIHPHNKNILISIGYSERGRLNENSNDFKVIAEDFINGIKIKEIKEPITK